ncbi:unnamed protein product, partial [Ectocarpus sp. 12 AP-2014]
ASNSSSKLKCVPCRNKWIIFSNSASVVDGSTSFPPSTRSSISSSAVPPLPSPRGLPVTVIGLGAGAIGPELRLVCLASSRGRSLVAKVRCAMSCGGVGRKPRVE